MDKTLDILRGIVERIDAGRSFAAALILRAEGSTPRKQGTRAAIDATGAIEGTIGGGVLEARAQSRAASVCSLGRPIALDVALAGVEGSGEDPLCGGGARVLLDPTAAKDRSAYAAAAGALERRERGILVTTVRGGAEIETSVEWIPEGGIPAEAPFPGSEALRSSLAREAARLFEGEAAGRPVEVLVEPLVPEPKLLIAGGGHIGQALALQANLLGFDVTVLDDRPEFTRAELYPEGTAALCGDISREVAAFPATSDTCIVIVTRGHQQDAAALAACIRSGAGYIGMIGSRRKVALLRDEFIESGRATAEEFDRVFAPIGLDIGAVTVPEIATSIAAQLVAARRKGAGAARLGGMPRQG